MFVSKQKLFWALMSMHTVYSVLGTAIFVFLVCISPWRSWWFYPLIAAAYTMYYFAIGARPINIHCRGSAVHHKLIAKMPCLRGRGYYPTPYMLNANIQTLFAALGRPAPGTKYERELVKGAYGDGETMVLDWSMVKDETAAVPVIVVFHGLTGGSDDSNMHYLTRFFNMKGWHCVIPVRRGCADDQLELNVPKFYEYGGLEDTEYVVEYISQKMLGHPLFGVGISAGSNVLVNYLGHSGRNSRILGAISVANGYCWQKGTEAIRDLHPVWDVIMGGMVHHTLFKRHNVFADHNVTASHVSCPSAPILPLNRVGSLREHDENVSWRIHGYANLEEFYKAQGCTHRIDCVVVPTIFLNALDDPIACGINIPKHKIASNPYTLLVTTESGGHLGWSVGWFPFTRKPTWMDTFILQGLESIMSVSQDSTLLKRSTSLDEMGERMASGSPPSAAASLSAAAPAGSPMAVASGGVSSFRRPKLSSLLTPTKASKNGLGSPPRALPPRKNSSIGSFDFCE